MIQRPSINYTSQFAILIGLMGVCIIAGSLVVSLISSLYLQVPFLKVGLVLSQPEHTNLSRVLNTLASFLAFFLPAFLLARFLSKHPFQQLGFNSKLSIQQILLVILITFASMVFSGALGDLNEHIPMPASWLTKAKAMEESYKTSMMSMANMKTPIDFLLSLLVLAAAPALFEEVLFRGGFQQILISWTKSKWIGIIITSIIFSAIHFSFFGFLPRLALGVVLGLIFYYSKNIWLNIFMHFLNNAFVVTELYILSRQGKSVTKTLDESMPIWWGLLAGLLLLIFLKPFIAECRRVLQTNALDTEVEVQKTNKQHG
jgi:uncharacterized protein